jgi:hypothetical protein
MHIYEPIERRVDEATARQVDLMILTRLAFDESAARRLGARLNLPNMMLHRALSLDVVLRSSAHLIPADCWGNNDVQSAILHRRIMRRLRRGSQATLERV